MSPYETQRAALRQAYNALIAAADMSQGGDDPEEYEMFSKAAKALNEAFHIV